jgi:hypothetical protein
LLEADLVGGWKATEDSIRFLMAENICCPDKEIKLTLFNDKTFELKNMPSCWTSDFKNCAMTTFNYKGTWSTYKREKSTWLHLSDKSMIYAVPFINRSEKIQIVFGVGDPDSGKEIYLTK